MAPRVLFIHLNSIYWSISLLPSHSSHITKVRSCMWVKLRPGNYYLCLCDLGQLSENSFILIRANVHLRNTFPLVGGSVS